MFDLSGADEAATDGPGTPQQLDAAHAGGNVPADSRAPRSRRERVPGIRHVHVRRQVLNPALNLSQAGVGMGFERNPSDGSFAVCSLLPRGSCRRSGKVFLRDCLLAVDNVDVVGKTVEEVSSMIQGPEDTDVLLTVETLDGLRERAAAHHPTPSESPGHAGDGSGASPRQPDMAAAVMAGVPEPVLAHSPPPIAPLLLWSPPDESGARNAGLPVDATLSVSASARSTSRTISPSQQGAAVSHAMAPAASPMQRCLDLCGALQGSIDHANNKTAAALLASDSIAASPLAHSTVGIVLRVRTREHTYVCVCVCVFQKNKESWKRKVGSAEDFTAERLHKCIASVDSFSKLIFEYIYIYIYIYILCACVCACVCVCRCRRLK